MAIKPKKYNYTEADGSFDYESYEEDRDTWADMQEDEAIDEGEGGQDAEDPFEEQG